ncbi:MAG: IS630 family transposase [bacterium]
MKRIKLPSSEIRILQNHARSPVELIRSKSLAILAQHGEVNVEALSLMFRRSLHTINRWIKEYSKKRISSIFSGMVGNENASKLTREQKKEVKKIVGLPPDKYGIPKKFWDVPKLKEYVNSEFGVVYESDASYHYLLRFSGLSLKYPDKLSPKRDEKLIKKRIKQIKKEIKPMLEDPEYVVLTADETRLQFESEIRRAWLVKGKRTIVKTERSKEHQNYLGFLDQRNGRCEVFPIERGNQQETIRVLKVLMKEYPNQKVCVIWDNARWHKGKVLRAELAKKKQLVDLHLINFPPYAPDHNPIEHVWQNAKSKISNKSDLPFTKIKELFFNSINQRNFNYKI